MFSSQQSDQKLDILWNQQLLLSYNYPSNGNRSFWHPLQLPDSPALTANEPSDHVHHQGLWLGWKKVNGVNFWEQPAPGGDPEGFGKVIHQSLSPDINGNLCSFEAVNSWIDWQGKQHLTEQRSTIIHAPTDRYLVIDVDFKVQSLDNAVTLDLLRGTPGHGGLFYSGFTVRFDNRLTPGHLLDADGRTEADQIFGQQSQWCGLAGTHAENERVYGITIIDQPTNPRYPTTWWVRNGKNYGLIHPSPTYYEPLQLAIQETLSLSYRVVIHCDWVDTDLINSLSTDNF